MKEEQEDEGKKTNSQSDYLKIYFKNISKLTTGSFE